MLKLVMSNLNLKPKSFDLDDKIANVYDCVTMTTKDNVLVNRCSLNMCTILHLHCVPL